MEITLLDHADLFVHIALAMVSVALVNIQIITYKKYKDDAILTLTVFYVVLSIWCGMEVLNTYFRLNLYELYFLNFDLVVLSLSSSSSFS